MTDDGGLMEDKVKKIYHHSIKILEQVGIRLKHPEIRSILMSKGIRMDHETAFFPQEQIEDWVKKAPQTFILEARNPVHNAVIGGRARQFVCGYGCSAIYEPDGRSRNATLRDYIRFAKLVHQSDHFSINGGILAQPMDIPPDLSHLVMVYAAMLVSDKCLMGIPGNETRVTQLLDLVGIFFKSRENLRQKPRLLTLVNTISPLLMDETALSTIMMCARYNQPLIISPASTAGTTGPVDLAGNLALSTAEALAGVVIAQMTSPGTPVVFGLQCNAADLRTGDIFTGSPAFALQTKYTAALARMLNLPSRSGGATTDASCVSPQSGYESMFSMITACLNGVNLMVHSAGILNSYAAVSYEKFILDLEILDMVKFYLEDITVTDETLNLSLIKEVGPGGQFLTSRDTLKKCRSHSWVPRVGVRGRTGNTSSSDPYFQNIRNELDRMLAAYERPYMAPEMEKLMDDVMLRQGVPAAILDRVKTLIHSDKE